MDNSILNSLYANFELKARQGPSNQMFKYVPSNDIVDRMNRVFKGNWSTEVINDKIVEDHILMLVRVHVTDPETGKVYFHDGYASQLVAKYNTGPNQGKIIDIGNSYKSAMSKAIKTAVAKWGVGLYLEEDTQEPTASDDTPPDFGSDSAPFPNIPDNSKASPDKPIDDGFPPFPGSDSKPEDPPANKPGPPFSAEPFPVFGSESGSGSAAENKSAEKVTDVQKTAVMTAMANNDLTFEEMVDKALNSETNKPTSLDDLTYLQAVKLLQYGNDLSKIPMN